MNPTTQVLVRFTKAPNGHSRLREDMRNALVGVMVKAAQHPNCFIANTDDLLVAIAAQRPPNVHFYWEQVLAHNSKPIFLGRSECEVVECFNLELIAPLPNTGLNKKICRACIGLKIKLEPNAFEPQKNGFYVRLFRLMYIQLRRHNFGIFSRHVTKLPAIRVTGKVFLPAHTCKVLT